MIPKPYIAQWQQFAPWKEMFQIEQDLLISRILVSIFSDEFLNKNLAFRGGTALYKLFVKPAPRYSEDIDLVQIHPGPIKPILLKINEVISFFEEARTTEIRANGVRIYYPFYSEYEQIKFKIKIEINSKEHFNVMGLQTIPFSIKNEWFSGTAQITTYALSELLGTKLRALYQRRKGRDLFDLYFANYQSEINLKEILHCYKIYMQHSNDKPLPSSVEYLNNIIQKELNIDFRKDMETILLPQISYNFDEAVSWLKNEIIPLIS